MIVKFQRLSEHHEEQKMLIHYNNAKICVLYIDDFETLLTESQYLKYKKDILKQITVDESDLFDLAITIYGEIE